VGILNPLSSCREICYFMLCWVDRLVSWSEVLCVLMWDWLDRCKRVLWAPFCCSAADSRVVYIRKRFCCMLLEIMNSCVYLVLYLQIYLFFHQNRHNPFKKGNATRLVISLKWLMLPLLMTESCPCWSWLVAPHRAGCICSNQTAEWSRVPESPQTTPISRCVCKL
jgi:hypothetical protein